MQSRSNLLQLFKQMRPRHIIRSTTLPLPYQGALSRQSASTFKPTPSQTYRLPPQVIQPSCRRLFHSTTPPQASPTLPSIDSSSTELPPADTPKYQLTFTCKPCTHRSTHTVSKHGYEKGTVLVQCPSCKNRHVISDHLKIFSDKRITLEDIMREKGELVRRGSVGPGGDVEFWDEK